MQKVISFEMKVHFVQYGPKANEKNRFQEKARGWSLEG